jgi:FXSXX-COOH protein
VADQRPSGGPDWGERFGPEVIDLSSIDSFVLENVPSAILRDAIRRVSAELAAAAEPAAFFQSGLRRVD